MYDRRYGDRQLSFEASGALWQASLVMRDRETDSWWSIMTSRAIGGEMDGADLVELPLGEQIRWGEWRARHPDSLVLSVDGREHEPIDPYDEYFANDRTFRGIEVEDRRLAAKEPVFGFFHEGRPYVVPHAAVAGRRVFELPGGARLLVSRPPGAEMRASTGAWRVPAGKVAKGGEPTPAGELEEAGFEPLAGIDTFWYNWAAVNRESEILR